MGTSLMGTSLVLGPVQSCSSGNQHALLEACVHHAVQPPSQIGNAIGVLHSIDVGCCEFHIPAVVDVRRGHVKWKEDF